MFFNFPFIAPFGIVRNITRTNKDSTESLHIKWNDVRRSQNGGFVEYYNITLQETSSTNIQKESFMHNYTKFGNTFSFVGLKNFTEYKIGITAGNGRGFGPIAFVTLKTPENGKNFQYDRIARLGNKFIAEISKVIWGIVM